MTTELTIVEAAGRKVSVVWLEDYLAIDPRNLGKPGTRQWVTTCLVRPLDIGPKTVFYGVTVLNPTDLIREATGKKVSLMRALEQMFPDEDPKEINRLARVIVRSLTQPELAAEVVTETIDVSAM